MKRGVVAVVAALLAVVLGAGVASAHVTVWPKQAAPGAFEKYTVRVPTEKDIPTVKVELMFPEGLTVSSIQPKPGWTYEVQKDAAGNTTGVIWQGGQIGPGEFDEFSFVAANPEQPGALSFAAVQTYADGSVVNWDGPEGSEHPASVTTIAAGAAGSSDAGATASDSAPLGAAGTFWLSVAAVVLGLAALVVAIMGRRPGKV